MMSFEVQTYTFCDGWINTWMDDDEKPVTFETLEQASEALRDYLEDLKVETLAGNITDFDASSFRVYNVA